jgi:predicted GNAT family acetyltransferase
MADAIKVEREDGDSGGRYVVYLQDGSEAEMTYGREGNAIVVDHTFVPPEHRAEGIAQKLVEAAVADARRDDFKIVPVCSYVVAQFRRHPEWADLKG